MGSNEALGDRLWWMAGFKALSDNASQEPLAFPNALDFDCRALRSMLNARETFLEVCRESVTRVTVEKCERELVHTHEHRHDSRERQEPPDLEVHRSSCATSYPSRRWSA